MPSFQTPLCYCHLIQSVAWNTSIYHWSFVQKSFSSAMIPECYQEVHLFGDCDTCLQIPKMTSHSSFPWLSFFLFFFLNDFIGLEWPTVGVGVCLFIYLFIYLFMAVLRLRFCERAFSSCSKRGPLFIAVCEPLTIAASLVAEHRL